ncbi:MAG: hypothetical protein P5683_25420 [Limnospira sp. PMC 1279.21]|uniref:Uncharacterized protein n=3 Tax=Limnospira TaxID=2596745 RepID=A0A9P1P2B3_9CYAN|nr:MULTISPECIES: hypothetical protein [unclassified Limnospira]EDZ93740.1 hypothetical protein AmaxDRAFT_3515 [Limnospira maxima CS-328]EKD08079.1 hypothetical protein SPLC1_S270010 [Arthrospira platensis C1]MDT9288114.1 hypothetical protein [Limnospira sp. PMC 1298.21]CDM97150.1 hypothetical protein ARTHRO_50117 [Limnospira indica PCC 8005]MDT9180923.1 hypothetical protein [Limnospira sp. PMC 1238.20]
MCPNLWLRQPDNAGRLKVKTECWKDGRYVMVEREVAFPNSNSKPCLRVSQHTAPDVDTLLSVGTGLQPPA